MLAGLPCREGKQRKQKRTRNRCKRGTECHLLSSRLRDDIFPATPIGSTTDDCDNSTEKQKGEKDESGRADIRPGVVSRTGSGFDRTDIRFGIGSSTGSGLDGSCSSLHGFHGFWFRLLTSWSSDTCVSEAVLTRVGVLETSSAGRLGLVSRGPHGAQGRKTSPLILA